MPGLEAVVQACVLRSDASVSVERLRRSEIPARVHGVHARDVRSLSLRSADVVEEEPLGWSSRSSWEFKAAPAIVPKRGAVIVCLGDVKAVVLTDRCVFFETHLAHVQDDVEWIAKACQPENEQEKTEWEIRVLEAIIRNVDLRFSRKAMLFQSSVEFLLKKMNMDLEKPQMKYLASLKHAIVNLEMQVRETREAVFNCLSNEEDMLGLLISEKQRRNSNDLEMDLHAPIELMLETYHRRLALIQQQLTNLLYQIASQQEMATMNLDLFRNRLIRMNVYMGILSVSLTCSTTISSIFGMNLTSGVEHHPRAFFVISLFSTGLMATMASYLMMSIKLMREDVIRDLSSGKDEAYQRLFGTHIALIEQTLWSIAFNEKEVEKSTFRRKLSERAGFEISDQDMCLILDIIEQNKEINAPLKRPNGSSNKTR